MKWFDTRQRCGLTTPEVSGRGLRPLARDQRLAVGDHSRLAYAEVLPGERPLDCVAFLNRVVSWYRGQGVVLERVPSQRQRLPLLAWRDACAVLGIARRYTRPRRPQTNGKAEALVKTLQRECAYRFAYPRSAYRARALPGHLRWYNRDRPTARSAASRRSAASHRSVSITAS